jgi:DNA-binding CsgD family transcriptional regulator
MLGEADEGTVLLDLVGEVVGLLDLDELRRGLLGALRRTMPMKWASLNDVGPDGVEALVEPQLDDVWFGRFAELAHENPIYQRWRRTRDGRAYRFSDVATREQLEATRLYREVYAPLGIHHQVAFALPNEPDRILAVVLHREDRDFTDAERDFLNRARPFLIQAYRNAIAYSDGRRGSSTGLQRALVAEGLTPRQAEVLRLVALGGSNRAAAARLGVSDRTVQKHLEHAYRKLGVSTRSDAAARAWQLPLDGLRNGERPSREH